jgi:stalled ribosome alternative rescue factor ArfA
MPLLCSGVASLLWQKLFRVAIELRIPAGSFSYLSKAIFFWQRVEKQKYMGL